MRYLGVALICLFLPLSANAKIYKWVDANGTTHYSQTPPKNRKATNLELPKDKVPSGSSQHQSVRPANGVVAAKTMNLSADRGQEQDVDCRKAVNNAHTSINTMLKNAKENLQNGYIDEKKYREISEKLAAAVQHTTVDKCEASTGADREFYVCMSGGQYENCANQFSP